MNICSYILPIRRSKFSKTEAHEFADYFKTLTAAGCEVLVIDGSPPQVFAEHDKIWSKFCRHERVDPRFQFLNDKVNGIHTGVRLARNEKIVLADDDIRYTPINLGQMCALLEEFEVVRPQNYLYDPHLSPLPRGKETADTRGVGSPLPQGEEAAERQVKAIVWWGMLESARMLINRATLRTADYPGTCGFRRQTFLDAGEYDGDVLFDNEELIRHLVRHRARIVYTNNFFVAKRSPTFRKWLEQRPRQAYEDFGLRFKTALFASLLPIAITLAFLNLEWLSIFAVFALSLSILLALSGWLRGDARKYFPFHACLFAPLWVLERSVSTYWAFYWLITRGGYPFGKRLLTKGIGRDWIEGGRIGATMVDRSNS